MRIIYIMRQKLSVLILATRLQFCVKHPVPCILCLSPCILFTANLMFSDHVSPAQPTRVMPEISIGSSVAQTRRCVFSATSPHHLRQKVTENLKSN